MKDMLKKIIEEHRPLTNQGQVADYIPALGNANLNHLGIAVYDSDGKYYEAGESQIKFTIQSVSKPLVLLLALIDSGEEEVFSKVGMEPTGDPFNSIIRLETFDKQKPLNPFINAGAISIVSLIKGKDNIEKIERILEFVRRLADNDNISVDNSIFLSEKVTGDRNRSMLYFLKSIGNIEGNVEDILDLYFMQCAIKATAKDLARIGLVLSHGGYDPIREEQIVPKREAKIVSSIMATCGMYDESGEFAVKVGIPAKSGVGGGIICTVPKRYGIGVFGPSLDRKGNSIGGVKVLEDLSREFDMSIY
ncbi:glutaminase A [Acidaminobacter sp. JC074]|uniref:glutaminase A n=1 Tax=Acidaminobacter sp. JC074 TaxID=2530199 RepID=UPI001F112AD7|nr:glutaminase A [Acidaminobacter sp. JC074]MCH4890362.1 glutaminase A [Acidaminobacter sp. JC074]